MTDCEGLNEDWIDLRVARRWQEATGIVAFELVDPQGRELPCFEAGAYIDVLTPQGHLRPYSLCNPPHDRGRYVIAVLKEPGGRGGSLCLHEQVRAGDSIRVRRPRNEFALCPYSVYSVLIAGGVGIAPLLAMASSLWSRGAAFELHYVARNPVQAAFSAQLSREAFASRVRVRWTESQGRPDFAGLMRAAPFAADVYICGPSGFMAHATQAFVRAGRPPARLHTEGFHPTPDRPSLKRG